MVGGGALPDFLFCYIFLIQQTTSGIGHRLVVLRKIRTRLDLLSVFHLEEKNVVVGSHVQRVVVLATEETTVTQQVSHRPMKW